MILVLPTSFKKSENFIQTKNKELQRIKQSKVQSGIAAKIWTTLHSEVNNSILYLTNLDWKQLDMDNSGRQYLHMQHMLNALHFG